MNQPNPFAAQPGQRSVWDFPRPAIAEPESEILRVEFNGQVVARSAATYRTLETSHPPSYYFPPSDILSGVLKPTSRTSMCEWKGRAIYFDVVVGDRVAAQAAWCYPAPTAAFADMKDHVAFYPAKMDACFVGDERVTPQAGEFYGGWITRQYVGPFKGAAGSGGW